MQTCAGHLKSKQQQIGDKNKYRNRNLYLVKKARIFVQKRIYMVSMGKYI